MTERWRRSLRELDTVDPSPELWERAVDRSVRGPLLPDVPAERPRIVAAIVAVIVAATGVVIALFALRGLGTSPEVGGLVTYRNPSGTWEIRYPEGFHRGEIPFGSDRLVREGVWVATFDSPRFRAPAYVPALSDLPDDGVIVFIYQIYGGLLSGPAERDSAFPITVEDLEVVPGPHSSWRGSVIANGEEYKMEVSMGPRADPEDRRAAAKIVSSLRFLPLQEGTATGRQVTFYVLGPVYEYAVGSVTRFEPSTLPRTEQSDPFPFYLVRVRDGFFALAWPGNLVGGYQDCDVRYDPAAQEFACPNGARWALDGSVIDRPDPTMPKDRLSVLLVRLSLDGHVLVSPTTFTDSIEHDLRLTGG